MTDGGYGASQPGGGAARQREAVAIIGMACIFPKARDVDAFWANVLSKVDAVGDPTNWALDPELVRGESPGMDRIYCTRGGFLGDLARFDPLAHGIPPVSVGGDPDQWLALQLARDALLDAGYPDLDEQVRRRTAVILGRGAFPTQSAVSVIQASVIVPQTIEIIKALQPEISEDQLEAIRQGLRSSLPPLRPEVMPGVIPNLSIGRIANRLDLMGPNYSIDAACASSLVAMQLGVRDLLSGDCDLALAGGAHVLTPIPLLSVFCQLGALSRREQIRPFDKDADGTLLGEGIGVLVLKRLSDAERDGDRIYALIRGVGVSSDGRAVGLLAPRVDGEELAIRRAFEAAGVDPGSVSLIEAHGTGTPVGDVVEIEALRRVFGERTSLLPPIALGSVKSQLSHMIQAAGAAGMMKTALALYHRVLPPTINCSELNPRLELEKTPFYINTQARPWVHGRDEPRRAGVSAFGFGGINAHVVLEEYRPDRSRAGGRTSPHQASLPDHRPPRDSEVCILEAPTAAALLAKADALRRFSEGLAAAEEPVARLEDIAYTLSLELAPEPAGRLRLAVVAASLSDLATKLARAAERLADPECRQIRERAGIYYAAEPLAAQGKLAFIMAGEGAQYTNMLADLPLHFPQVGEAFDGLDAVFLAHGGEYLPSDVIFPRPAFLPEEARWAEEKLWQMDIAVASVLTADEALLSILRGSNVRPDVILGHSAGEWPALYAGGVFGEAEEADQAWRALRRFSDETDSQGGIRPGSLLAIAAERSQIEKALRDGGVEFGVALDNCPHQVVVVVEPEDAGRARDVVQREGWIAEELAFDRPYHTAKYAPYAERLDAALAPVALYPPRIPVYSCTTSAPFPSDPHAIRRLMSEHWISTVEFRRTVETLHAEGVRVFLEVGPRGLLTAFVEDILRGKPFVAVASNVQQRSGVSQVNHMIGLLAAHGVAMSPAYLFEGRSPRRVDWSSTEVEAAAGHGATALLNAGFPILSLSPALTRDLDGRVPRERAPSSNGQVPAAQQLPAARVAGEPSQMAAAAAPPAAAAPVAASQPQGWAYAHGFLETMERFLEVQERVMGRYLSSPAADVAAAMPLPSLNSPAYPSPYPRVAAPNGDSPFREVEPPAAILAPPTETLISAAAAPASEPRPHAPAPTPDDAQAAPLDRASLSKALLELVSDRTGYPLEALSLDADLEADLGVDSIKRVEVLGLLRQRYRLPEAGVEDFGPLRTMSQIVDALIEKAAGRTEASTPASESPSLQTGAAANHGSRPFPLLGEIAVLEPGRRLVSRRTFDLEADDLYLRDHTLGRSPSALDPELRSYAMMPLIMSLEILAEAASALVPGKVVTALREIRASRWLPFETAQTLEVSATCESEDGARVHASLRNLTEDGESGMTLGPPVVEAVVVLGSAYPEPAVAQPAPLENQHAPRMTAEQFYAAMMFHGPLWQGVASVKAIGDNGVRTELQVLPSSSLVRGDSDPRLVLDPLTLDAAGQTPAIWGDEYLPTGQLGFPFWVEAIEIMGPRRPAGEVVDCEAIVTLVEHLDFRADITVSGREGKDWLRIRGWTCRRFHVDEPLTPVLYSPAVLPDLCESWTELEAALSSDDRFECLRLRARFSANSTFLTRVWAMRILSRAEREEFRHFASRPGNQTRWVAARHAAKEAAIRLLRWHFGLEPRPPDVEVQMDEAGGWSVEGAWGGALRRVVGGVAQAEDWTVAVAGLEPEGPQGLCLSVTAEVEGSGAGAGNPLPSVAIANLGEAPVAGTATAVHGELTASVAYCYRPLQ